jgi:hypothetical protein
VALRRHRNGTVSQCHAGIGYLREHMVTVTCGAAIASSEAGPGKTSGSGGPRLRLESRPLTCGPQAALPSVARIILCRNGCEACAA